MKKMDKNFFLVLIVLLVIIGVYFQFAKPIKVIRSKIDCYISEGADMEYEYISTFAETYEKYEWYKDTTILHSWNGTLPSENPDDYMTINWDITLKNRSSYGSVLVDAHISDITSHKEAVLISHTASHAVAHYMDGFSKRTIWVLATVCIKDLNTAQIEELIKGMTVEVQFSGELMGTRTKTVKYKAGDILEFHTIKE